MGEWLAETYKVEQHSSIYFIYLFFFTVTKVVRTSECVPYNSAEEKSV